ncbi:UDP-glycosyltransferase 73C6-like [Curcuma longa]|uniref:UDP-glycosyltransferase 73C6-like n=1 Tax=Curcuma longa TaxID=136217 RepID=UPI003D9E97F4
MTKKMIDNIEPSSGPQKPHFVLVPLFAQGHMIPMTDLACLLAARGALVTIVTSPVNSARIKSYVDRANADGLLIRLAELHFPCAEVGLPEGSENVDLVTTSEKMEKFFLAMSMLTEPLVAYLRQQWPKPTCLVCDSCNPWTRDVARELGLRRFIFHGPSCFFLLCSHNVHEYASSGDVPGDIFKPFFVPGLPQKIEVVRVQALRFFDHPGWEKFLEQKTEAEATADGLIINTFRELEAPFLDLYQSALGKTIWHIGPVSLANKEPEDAILRGDKTIAEEAERISNWLDAKDTASVIYVSFGTIVTNSPSHTLEIGTGLEASNRPFIWVIKQWDISPEVEKWLPELEERTMSRGLILKAWAPQVMILSHPSVGAFLTHCGWNSTLEAVSFGVPMITWPHLTDQFLNENLVVKVLRTGVSLKPQMKTPLVWGESEGLITREDVELAMEAVMDEGEEAQAIRQRAKQLALEAKRAMEPGGSSYESLTLMIQHALDSAVSAPDPDPDSKDATVPNV